MANRYSLEAFKAFDENRDEFFMKHFPDLFKEEIFIKQRDKSIRLHIIDRTMLCSLPLAHIKPKLPYESQFSLAIIYKHYYEYDSSTESWVEKHNRYQPNSVNSPQFKGVFRDEVDFGWR